MTVDVVADGTSDSLQMMGAISCKLYIEHILMQQTPDRLLVPSQIPLAAAPRVTAPATTAKLVKVFDEDDIAAAIQVPLYYKSKGKGRGKPVFFAPEKTAVGQLFGKYSRQHVARNTVTEGKGRKDRVGAATGSA